MIGRVHFYFLHQTLRMGGVSQFACVQLLRVAIAPFCCVFFIILKMTFDLNIWWSVTQFAPRIARVLAIVNFIPASGDDEVYHMPMSRSGMRPGALVGILLFEHGVWDTSRSKSGHSANRSLPVGIIISRSHTIDKCIHNMIKKKNER